MKKKAVGIDVDGVLADTISRWLSKAELKFGIKATKKNVTKYELYEIFPGITHKDVLDSWASVWDDYKTIQMEDPDIPSIMDNLHDRFDIWITTANPSQRINDWLRENGIAYDRLINFSSHEDKHKLDGVEIYVDDFHEVVEKVAKHGKKAIILRQPWNDAFIKNNKDPNVLVACNWRDVENMLLNYF